MIGLIKVFKHAIGVTAAIHKVDRDTVPHAVHIQNTSTLVTISVYLFVEVSS